MFTYCYTIHHEPHYHTASCGCYFCFLQKKFLPNYYVSPPLKRIKNKGVNLKSGSDAKETAAAFAYSSRPVGFNKDIKPEEGAHAAFSLNDDTEIGAQNIKDNSGSVSVFSLNDDTEVRAQNIKDDSGSASAFSLNDDIKARAQSIKDDSGFASLLAAEKEYAKDEAWESPLNLAAHEKPAQEFSGNNEAPSFNNLQAFKELKATMSRIAGAAEQLAKAADENGQRGAEPFGLLGFRQWWELIEVTMSVGGDKISGIPIFTEKDAVRVVDNKYSYFVPLGKIDYIRTNDGLRSGLREPGKTEARVAGARPESL